MPDAAPNPAARVMPIARRVVMAATLCALAYGWWRYSFVAGPADVLELPYAGARLLLDHRPGWGRALASGDVVLCQVPGEAAPRFLLVAGVGGDPVSCERDRLVVAGDGWRGRAGPALDGLQRVPDGALLLLTHRPDAVAADSRTLGPLPATVVIGRVVWYFTRVN